MDRRDLRRLPAVHFTLAILGVLALDTGCSAHRDPLPSWNDGPNKQAVITFVRDVTKRTSPSYVPPAERIATFDNDGTLWSEQPMYFQLRFILDRIRAISPEHPDWWETQPFKAVLEDDMETVHAAGVQGLMTLAMAASAGMTTEAFKPIVKEWVRTAKHPRFKRPYTECVYQPMLELLTYLRANQFKTYICSGGGMSFIRPWAEEVYGIPPEQVIGSSIKTAYMTREGKPVLLHLAELNFLNDKDTKPVGIEHHIGRRPIAAFGNSDGDHEMLQWTAAGEGRRMMMLIHHTDAEREWKYDRKSSIGHLDKALDDARRQNWNVVDMQMDWKVIYPFNLE